MATRYRGSPGEVRALDAYIKLVRAAESVTARLSAATARAGLTTGQFGVLEALFHLGPLCGRDLGRKLLRSGGNVTTVVDNLERRGLVRRERSGDDRRFVAVHLTGEGRDLIRRLFPRHVANLVREMESLGAGEQEELARLCKKLGTGNGGRRRART
jgi:MarR family transcriptional regulator, 2-MHQ and catechol-resistance regulon repressor